MLAQHSFVKNYNFFIVDGELYRSFACVQNTKYIYSLIAPSRKSDQNVKAPRLF